MRIGRVIAIMAAALAAVAAWAVLLLAGTLGGWWRAPIAPPGDERAFVAAAMKLAEGHPGNLAFVLIEDGRPVAERFSSAGAPVDRDSLFQVASLSKWITAWGVLSLVEAGRLDLDAPIETYLTRWRLPPSEHDVRQVTARRLLSHTAGMTDGLGYAGFAPGAPVQTLEASLTRAADASPGAEGAVRMGAPAGEWRYSGGGYTLLQLVVEEVSGEPFAVYMRRAVLDPLGMTSSSFAPPADASRLAGFYDAQGKPATHYRFTAAAAASLYTSAADLTRFIQAHLPGPEGQPPGRGVLSPELLREMEKPHARQYGADIWGLGVVLYAPNGGGGNVIGHDGSNEPAINTAARFDPASGDGVVVLETGDPSLATRLAGEWVFWRTGEVDVLTVTLEAERTLTIFAVGAALILLLAIAAAWRLARRPKAYASSSTSQ